MAFWNFKKNLKDDYNEYCAKDRRAALRKGQGLGWLKIVSHTLLLGFAGALFVGAAGLISGPAMAEKLLTALASFVGIAWIGLILLVYFCLISKQAWPAVAGFFCWLALTIGGNQFVSYGMAVSLEAPYRKINVYELEPFDIIVVLGGGTSSTVTGKSQLSSNGDRISVAARMYHGGQVKRLVCTGTQTLRAGPNDLHMREESAEILIGLGVPASAILQMQGENTSQEMANLKTWLEENEVSGRVGLLTSAWHLPRAMRLAKSQGLNVHPIPSNFLSIPMTPTPSMIVPEGNKLHETSLLVKEYLARIVGR